MAWKTFEQFNVTGPEGLFIYPSAIWAGWTPLLLFGIFSIITLSTYFAQKSSTGRGDFLSSFTVGSWLTLIVCYAMSLIPGVIGPTPVIIFLLLTIVSTLILLLSDR